MVIPVFFLYSLSSYFLFSRTLVRQGLPVKKAAELAGVAEATIYIAQNRLKGKEQCPCCGQVVREGFVVNKDVLKDSAA